jgi:hypothetical protein
MTASTPTQNPTHAQSASLCHYNEMKRERMTMAATRRVRRLVIPAAVLVILVCSRLVKGRGSLATAHKLRGMDSFQLNENQVVVLEGEKMCDGRPRNHSLAWTSDEDWHSKCHLNWHEASPHGQWTQTEFTKFVERQVGASFKDFQQLPLPLTMIFNELSCQCEGRDCCHGANAMISNVNDEGWMDSICNRVDHALNEVCRRQQRRSQGSEL